MYKGKEPCQDAEDQGQRKQEYRANNQLKSKIYEQRIRKRVQQPG